jgi:cytochrome c oxidase cbb3-type subunit III
MIAGAVLLGLIVFSLLAHSQRRPGADQSSSATNSNSEPRQVFAANCGSCHGLDGSGTQRAPNIKAGSRVEQLSPAELLRIISDGIPGTGMPSFRSLGDAKLKALVDYVNNLQGSASTAPIPGNSERGKKIFFASGGCSSCHMINGAGGFIAPDLTDYGNTHTPELIKAAITKAESRDAPQHFATAVTSDGHEYRGMVRNEDNFSLQLQSMDGKFYFLSKAELQRVDRIPGSIMPSDYGSKLSAQQIDDLINYLVSVSKSSEGNSANKDEDED